MTRTANPSLERFYKLLARLNEAPAQGRALCELPTGTMLPLRGVYFFYEPGEFRAIRATILRIVRIGTHGLRTGSKSTLYGRLKQHLGTRTLGGNHRCSIFRLHVGNALLARSRQSLPTWGKGSSASPHVRECEADHEKRVSEYIGKMRTLWVSVPDEPGPQSERALIERNAIALLSNRFAPVDSSSKDWLGRYSPKKGIRDSALWNLNHVDEAFDTSFLKRLEWFVELTCNSKQCSRRYIQPIPSCTAH